ncbi:MAG: ATP-binding protein [Xanthomonadales bacterium]|nr:ATP-binding protein [Xanthomonadales bacterium]
MKSMRRNLRTATVLVALALMVAAIEVVPWYLSNRSTGQALSEHARINRDARAISAYIRIRTALSDIDRSVFWLLLAPGQAQMRVEIARARDRIQTDLDFLRHTMSEDARQGALVAQLQVLVDTRRAEVGRVISYIDEGRLELAQEMLSATGSAMPLREWDTLLENEHEALLGWQRKLIDSQRQQFRHSANLILSIQLLLLMVLLLGLTILWRRRSRMAIQARTARRNADRILSAVREPIVQLDANLRVRLCNPAFANLYSAEHGNAADYGNLLDVPLATVGSGVWNDAALLQRLRDVLLMDRELWDYELEQDTPASGRRTLLINAWRMPERGDSGEALIVTATDITARRQAERQVQELNQRLNSQVDEISQINADLESFNYSVSHDLRAPLRHIAAFSSKLGRELDVDPDTRAGHYLRVIGDSAVRMAVLIDELLTYSRLGRSPVRVGTVDMASLVAETRIMLAESSAERTIDWQVDDLPVIRGDASLLRLVWQNLLGNAVKYTSRTRQPRIQVRYQYQVSEDEHVFRVIDNGAGFDMAYIDKLFGVFQRLHAADEFPGTGIGLANVRRSLARMGGRVWAEGRPGQGATFHFALPGGHTLLLG